MSAVGVNVQKFYTDLIEDIIPSNPKVATKCLSFSLSNETGDDIELSKWSKLEIKSNQTLYSESVVYPHYYQELEFEVLAINMMKKLSTSSLQEENASVDSTQKDMSKKKKPVGHHFDEDACRDIPEVMWPLHKTTYVGEHSKHVMRQDKVLIQLHSLLPSNRTGVVDYADQMSNGGILPTNGMQVRDCPNPRDDIVTKIGTMEVNLEDNVK